VGKGGTTKSSITSASALPIGNMRSGFRKHSPGGDSIQPSKRKDFRHGWSEGERDQDKQIKGKPHRGDPRIRLHRRPVTDLAHLAFRLHVGGSLM
jgi:hypothetical protein